MIEKTEGKSNSPATFWGGDNFGISRDIFGIIWDNFGINWENLPLVEGTLLAEHPLFV
jgi:hypothetical protein